MSKDSICFLKSKKFSVRAYKLYKYLTRTKKEFILSKQFIRSATSIGANLSEAVFGQSIKDFEAKISISLKECSETLYWLDLLHEVDCLNDKEYQSINDDCLDLYRMLLSTLKTLRSN